MRLARVAGVRSILVPFLVSIVSAGCSRSPSPPPRTASTAAPAAVAAPPAAPVAAPSPAPEDTPPVAAPAPADTAVATADGPAVVAEGPDAAAANGSTRPDLSRIPRFIPGPNRAEDELKLDGVSRYLDPYHQDTSAAVGVAMGVVIELPRSAPARYLLACALAANGFHDDARAVLAALRAARDCPSCRDALLNVVNDGECEFLAGEVAVAKGLKPSAIRAATGAVLRGLTSGDEAAALPYLDASHRARFTFAGSECEGDCNRTERYSRKDLVKLIRGAFQRDEAHEDYLRPTRLFCDQTCCGGPNPSHSDSHRVHVTRMCFSAGQRPLLRSLDG
jgi:hypothetical protein